MLVACVNVMQNYVHRCLKNLRASLVNPANPAMIDSYPVHFPAYRTLLPYEYAGKCTGYALLVNFQRPIVMILLLA